jgi:hypothetical protein
MADERDPYAGFTPVDPNRPPPDPYAGYPAAQPGLSQGELIPGKGDPNTLVQPPGWLDAAAAAQTTRDAMRSGANTGTFGMFNRGVGAYDAAIGAAPDYTTGVNEAAKRLEEAKKRSPIATTVGDVIAGGASGMGLARAGITAVPYLTSRLGGIGTLLGNVGEGATYGAASAAGETYTGKPEDYLWNAGKGALVGGPLGGVLSGVAGPVGEGVYRGVGSTTGIPARLAEAGRTDAAGLQEIIAGARGPRAMLPDAGPAMTGTAQGAVLDPNREGAAALINALRARNESSAPYIDQTINNVLRRAPVPSHVVRDEVRPAIDALSPHYDAAYNNARAVDTRPLANWLDAQIINTRGPAQDAARQARSMLDLTGVPGTLDPHPRTLGAARSAVRAMRDNQNLDDNTRRVMGQTYDQMTSELQTRVPGIRQLDAQRAELGAQEDALGTRSPGSRAFDTARETVIRPAELQDIMHEAAVPKGSAVGPSAEPFRLQQATRAELDRIVGTNRNDLLALERVLANPQDYNSQKLATMFGQDRADQITSLLRNERIGRDTDTMVRGGSQTATRQAAQRAQDAASGRTGYDTTVTGLLTKAAAWGKDQLFQAQANAQRDRIAGFMAANNPAEVQAAARQLLAIQPQRDTRAALVRTMMQGGGRGASSGFIPKDYRTE